jgi:hypothetical protein
MCVLLFFQVTSSHEFPHTGSNDMYAKFPKSLSHIRLLQLQYNPKNGEVLNSIALGHMSNTYFSKEVDFHE